jgi:hypothetical protein
MSTELIIACIGLAFVAGLMLWTVITVRQFERSYRHDGSFTGRRYDCRLQWAYAEGSTQCTLGADRSALYLFRSRNPWGVTKCDLRVPWTDLEWRPRKILFTNVMWFYVRSKRMHFHVPRDIGESLLADAGRGPRGAH